MGRREQEERGRGGSRMERRERKKEMEGGR